MKIIEDITYSIDDIVDQINSSFGFSYVEDSDHEGYILLGNNIRLDLVFNEDERKLDSAKLSFPSDVIELSKSQTQADIYSSSIESSVQIVDLVNRMLGGNQNDEDT